MGGLLKQGLIGASSSGAAASDRAGTGNLDGDANGLIDTAEFGVALGSQPSSSLLVGAKSVNVDGSTALNTLGTESVTIQANTTAASRASTGTRAITIGYNSGQTVTLSTQSNTVAIGQSISSMNQGSVGIGFTAQGNGQQAVAIGNNPTASGNRAIAIGRLTDATQEGAIAIGGADTPNNGAQATGLGSIALGGKDGTNLAAVASGDQSISIGTGSNATASAAIQLGDGTNSTADSCQIGSSTNPLEIFLNLPTSAGTTGSLWNDSGTVKVS